jgi:hypothetical protein
MTTDDERTWTTLYGKIAKEQARAERAEQRAAGLEAELEQANDTNRIFEEWLNKYWGLLYPDNPTGWEYPGQVFNHIQIELGRLAALAAPAGEGGG